jgi:hypothetical protein
MTDTIPADVPSAVRAAIEASNAHDTEGFLACFADTGAVNDWGRVFTGHDAIRGWSDREFIGKNVTLTDLRFRVTGGSTELKAQVGGDGFNGPSTFTFDAEGDRLARMTIRA